MGFQRLIPAALLFALLLGSACTKPADPDEVREPVDPEAIALASRALSVAARTAMAFPDRTLFLYDTVLPPIRYDETFLDSTQLLAFRTCLDSFQRHPGEAITCNYWDTTRLGILHPGYYARGDSVPLWFYRAKENLHYFLIYTRFDSLRTSAQSGIPEFMAFPGGLWRANIEYKGMLDNTGIYRSSAFEGVEFVYTLIPRSGPLDSVMMILWARQGAYLKPGGQADSGLIETDAFYRADSGLIAAPAEGQSLFRFVTVRRFIFTTRNAVFSIDTVYDKFRFRETSSGDRYYVRIARHAGGIVISDSAYVLAAGLPPAITGSGYRLTFRNGLRAEFASPYGAFTATTVTDTAGAAPPLSLVPTSDTLLAVRSPAGSNPDTVRLRIRGDSLAWNDSAVTVTSAAFSARDGVLRFTFSLRNPGSAAVRFEGSAYFNLYTRKGEGSVRNTVQGYRNRMSIDLDGESWLDDQRL